MRPNRVQDNVSGYFKEVGVFLNENSLISSLKEMAGSVVPFVESLGIYAVHLPHADLKISFRGLYQQVIVVVHKAVGMAYPVISFLGLRY